MPEQCRARSHTPTLGVPAFVPARCVQVEALRAERCTAVEGPGAECPTAFKPLPKFAHTRLPPAMLHATREFVAPSPIQSQCWPIILSGRDLIGIASTGSGKTLGFGLPMLAHIAAQRVRARARTCAEECAGRQRGPACLHCVTCVGRAANGRVPVTWLACCCAQDAGVVGQGKGKGPFAVVMAPTRELALQINQVRAHARVCAHVHAHTSGPVWCHVPTRSWQRA